MQGAFLGALLDFTEDFLARIIASTHVDLRLLSCILRLLRDLVLNHLLFRVVIASDHLFFDLMLFSLLANELPAFIDFGGEADVIGGLFGGGCTSTKEANTLASHLVESAGSSLFIFLVRSLHLLSFLYLRGHFLEDSHLNLGEELFAVVVGSLRIKPCHGVLIHQPIGLEVLESPLVATHCHEVLFVDAPLIPIQVLDPTHIIPIRLMDRGAVDADEEAVVDGGVGWLGLSAVEAFEVFRISSHDGDVALGRGLLVEGWV